MCEICKSESKKLISCPLLKGKKICLRCCFTISTGNPEMLRKIKAQNPHLLKDVVLKKCVTCIENLKKMPFPI